MQRNVKMVCRLMVSLHSRAMPRAKAHIRNLMDQYIDTQNKINELEAAIAEVSNGNLVF
jgi:hypothetical protein